MPDERDHHDELLDLAYAAGFDRMRLEVALDERGERWLRTFAESCARHLPDGLIDRFYDQVRDEVRPENYIRSDVGAAILEVLDARDEALAIVEQDERPCTHAEHLTAAAKARCSAIGVQMAHQKLSGHVEADVALAVLDTLAIHVAVRHIASSVLDEEGRRRFRENVRREIRHVEREIRDDVLTQAHARRCRRDANLDRHRAPRTRSRARGRRQRCAARRASGIRAGNDPGDDGPGELPPSVSPARGGHR